MINRIALALILATLVALSAYSQARTAEKLLAVSFSTLDTTPPDGSTRYCINCAPAPVTGICQTGGTGAVALKIAGAWNCLVSGPFACPTCVTSAAPLTLNQLVFGQGGQASAVLGSLGTTTTVLHGNAAGAPSFGSVAISTDVSGLGAGMATFLGTPSSANLASALADKTGTGLAVFATAPTFTTSISAPLVIGGTTVGGNAEIRSTSGVGTTDFIKFTVGNNGATEAARFTTSGGLNVGQAADVSSGVISAFIGYRIGNAAVSGKILQGNGTNFVASTPSYPLTAGTSGNVLTSNGTDWTSAAPAGAAGVGWSLTHSVDQIQTIGVVLDVALNTVIWDSDAFHTGSNSFITVPTGKGGKYLVGVFAALTSTATSVNVQLLQNGATFPLESTLFTTTGVGTTTNGSTIITLAAGDTLKLRVFSNGASNTTILAYRGSPAFWGRKID